MKTFTKYLLFCGAALVFWACGNIEDELNNLKSELNIASSSSSERLPTMDSRVVAYRRFGELDGVKKVIDDIDTLKSWFPKGVFYNEECNYFAVTFRVENDKNYMVLSQDMTLHSIHPDPTGKKNECDFYYPPIITYHAMLICDDKAGTIRNNVDFNSPVAYVDPKWDCEREGPAGRNAYFALTPSSSSWGEPVVATEMPVMSNKVISYQDSRYSYDIFLNADFENERIISNPEILKLLFPNDYDEQKGECNYFAIHNITSSTGSGHLVFANDMVLYYLGPSKGEGCVSTCDIIHEVMLVCDDKANTFKNNINLNGYYAVPSWDCSKWETVPEKGFFPNHPPPVMPKPVMDSRVVSYQNVEYAKEAIITNTDTLKLWFPHIFGNGQAKPECNYFAMTFHHRNGYYEPAILSWDTLNSIYFLYDVRPGAYGENCKSVIKNEGLYGAMLICDDKAFTLKNIISPHDTPYYYIQLNTYLDPNWDCESGVGAPTIDEIFF